jgi:hypothetical protein
MMNRIGLFSLALVAAVSLSSVSAYAQPVPGCNPQVLDAMQKKAQAKVAVDVAQTETIIDKPDSVLAMTCFSNSAGTTAVRGGSIFSGDFSTGLRPIIEDALQAFFDDFQDGAGFEAASIDYTATAISDTQTCDEVKNLWSTIKDQGVRAGLPMVTLQSLITGVIPTGGDPAEYTDNWQQTVTDGIFAALGQAITDLPDPAVPGFTPGQGLGCVMQTAGIALPAGVTCP